MKAVGEWGSAALVGGTVAAGILAGVGLGAVCAGIDLLTRVDWRATLKQRPTGRSTT